MPSRSRADATKRPRRQTSKSSPSTKPRISPRRLWRSTAPRAQHAWQVSAKAAAANTASGTRLQRTYSLLGQIHRRNKNQHRSQKWWKFFSLLRRSVGRLVWIDAELGGLEVGGDVKAEEVRRRLGRREELERQRREGEVWVRDVLEAKCYLAFSGVVRDAQFAALGVALAGVLSCVGGVVGLPEETREVVEVKGVSLRQTGVDRGEVVSREYASPAATRQDLDVGEVVPRGEIGGATVGKHDEAISTAVDADMDEQEDTVPRSEESVKIARRSTEAAVSQGKKRKDKEKGKKKSAIDDLFAGLM